VWIRAERVTAKLFAVDGVEYTFPEHEAKQFREVHPDDTIGVADLTQLDRNGVHEAPILATLHTRYQRNEIYTNVGHNMLISINPYKKLSIYTSAIVDRYIADAKGSPPHIFSVAQRALEAMIMDDKSQSVIMTGEAGSGKTEAAKLVLQFIAHRSAEKGSSRDSSAVRLDAQVLLVHPILEAFGHAKTVHNENSSRFGHSIELFFFNENGQTISGASLKDYLLDITRLSHHAQGERNFNIFYLLINAMERQHPNVMAEGNTIIPDHVAASDYDFLLPSHSRESSSFTFDENNDRDNNQSSNNSNNNRDNNSSNKSNNNNQSSNKKNRDTTTKQQNNSRGSRFSCSRENEAVDQESSNSSPVFHPYDPYQDYAHHAHAHQSMSIPEAQEKYEQLLAALLGLDFSEDEIKLVFKFVAGVLLLGNIRHLPRRRIRSNSVWHDKVVLVARLWGICAEELKTLILSNSTCTCDSKTTTTTTTAAPLEANANNKKIIRKKNKGSVSKEEESFDDDDDIWSREGHKKKEEGATVTATTASTAAVSTPPTPDAPVDAFATASTTATAVDAYADDDDDDDDDDADADVTADDDADSLDSAEEDDTCEEEEKKNVAHMVDSIAQWAYDKLFRFILRRVNAALNGDRESKKGESKNGHAIHGQKTITIVDMPGFETHAAHSACIPSKPSTILPHDSVQTFHLLQKNYSCEKLHAHFLHTMFFHGNKRSRRERYKSPYNNHETDDDECPHVGKNGRRRECDEDEDHYVDNRGVIQLFEGCPDPVRNGPGILAFLDFDPCMFMFQQKERSNDGIRDKGGHILLPTLCSTFAHHPRFVPVPECNDEDDDQEGGSSHSSGSSSGSSSSGSGSGSSSMPNPNLRRTQPDSGRVRCGSSSSSSRCTPKTSIPPTTTKRSSPPLLGIHGSHGFRGDAGRGDAGLPNKAHTKNTKRGRSLCRERERNEKERERQTHRFIIRHTFGDVTYTLLSNQNFKNNNSDECEGQQHENKKRTNGKVCDARRMGKWESFLHTHLHRMFEHGSIFLTREMIQLDTQSGSRIRTSMYPLMSVMRRPHRCVDAVSASDAVSADAALSASYSRRSASADADASASTNYSPPGYPPSHHTMDHTMDPYYGHSTSTPVTPPRNNLPSHQPMHRQTTTTTTPTTTTTTTTTTTLFEKLYRTQAHFVSCINPNNIHIPSAFDAPKVMHQLRCFSLLRAVKSRCSHGYPLLPLEFEPFFHRYFFLLSPEARHTLVPRPKIGTPPRCRRLFHHRCSTNNTMPLVPPRHVFDNPDTVAQGINALVSELQARGKGGGGHGNGDSDEIYNSSSSSSNSRCLQSTDIRVSMSKVWCSARAQQLLEARRCEALGPIVTRIQKVIRGARWRAHIRLARTVYRQLDEIIHRYVGVATAGGRRSGSSSKRTGRDDCSSSRCSKSMGPNCDVGRPERRQRPELLYFTSRDQITEELQYTDAVIAQATHLPIRLPNLAAALRVRQRLALIAEVNNDMQKCLQSYDVLFLQQSLARMESLNVIFDRACTVQVQARLALLRVQLPLITALRKTKETTTTTTTENYVADDEEHETLDLLSGIMRVVEKEHPEYAQECGEESSSTKWLFREGPELLRKAREMFPRLKEHYRVLHGYEYEPQEVRCRTSSGTACGPRHTVECAAGGGNNVDNVVGPMTTMSPLCGSFNDYDGGTAGDLDESIDDHHLYPIHASEDPHPNTNQVVCLSPPSSRGQLSRLPMRNSREIGQEVNDARSRSRSRASSSFFPPRSTIMTGRYTEVSSPFSHNTPTQSRASSSSSKDQSRNPCTTSPSATSKGPILPLMRGMQCADVPVFPMTPTNTRSGKKDGPSIIPLTPNARGPEDMFLEVEDQDCHTDEGVLSKRRSSCDDRRRSSIIHRIPRPLYHNSGSSISLRWSKMDGAHDGLEGAAAAHKNEENENEEELKKRKGSMQWYMDMEHEEKNEDALKNDVVFRSRIPRSTLTGMRMQEQLEIEMKLRKAADEYDVEGMKILLSDATTNGINCEERFPDIVPLFLSLQNDVHVRQLLRDTMREKDDEEQDIATTRTRRRTYFLSKQVEVLGVGTEHKKDVLAHLRRMEETESECVYGGRPSGLSDIYELRNYPDLRPAETTTMKRSWNNSPETSTFEQHEVLRRTQPLEYQAHPLQESLLKFKEGEHINSQLTQLSTQCFKNLLGYCGELPSLYPETLVYEILDNIKAYTMLRDEVYLHLMKQLRNNPSSYSEQRCWQLFLLVIKSVKSSPTMQPYVRYFLDTHDSSATAKECLAEFCKHQSRKSLLGHTRHTRRNTREFILCLGVPKTTQQIRDEIDELQRKLTEIEAQPQVYENARLWGDPFLMYRRIKKPKTHVGRRALERFTYGLPHTSSHKSSTSRRAQVRGSVPWWESVLECMSSCLHARPGHREVSHGLCGGPASRSLGIDPSHPGPGPARQMESLGIDPSSGPASSTSDGQYYSSDTHQKPMGGSLFAYAHANQDGISRKPLEMIDQKTGVLIERIYTDVGTSFSTLAASLLQEEEEGNNSPCSSSSLCQEDMDKTISTLSGA